MLRILFILSLILSAPAVQATDTASFSIGKKKFQLRSTESSAIIQSEELSSSRTMTIGKAMLNRARKLVKVYLIQLSIPEDEIENLKRGYELEVHCAGDSNKDGVEIGFEVLRANVNLRTGALKNLRGMDSGDLCSASGTFTVRNFYIETGELFFSFEGAINNYARIKQNDVKIIPRSIKLSSWGIVDI